MAQALVCAQDWLRPEITKDLEEAQNQKEVIDEEDFDELFELEQECAGLPPSTIMDY